MGVTIPVDALDCLGNFEILKAFRVDNVSESVTYLGYGKAGTLDDESYWAICRITVSGSITKWEWAGGNNTPSKIWDNRATYTYS